jgi:hypothetical protein
MLSAGPCVDEAEADKDAPTNQQMDVQGMDEEKVV